MAQAVKDAGASEGRWLDNHLWGRIYRWAKRRHPNKNQKGKAWWFTDPVTGQQLNRVQATVKTQRHVKVRSQANPFDPQWDGYFQQRDRQQARKASSGFRVNVLLGQQGLCPGCRQVIQVGEDLDLHHRDGNHQNNQIGNLALLHPNCHRQLHHAPVDRTEPPRPRGRRHT